MAATLENTRKYLSETATAGATSAGNVATLNRVILTRYQTCNANSDCK